ncbi:hypothetical protein C5167_049482 [Papaver somniferum]|uniref:Uncharacterized protein n=1 Tax=Papaver somniferum TaxID=3469 RepID=A0A4Y7KNT5_PAPSO|nr:hypothetical protein C5167_049482 [Papaver somniferum]
MGMFVAILSFLVHRSVQGVQAPRILTLKEFQRKNVSREEYPEGQNFAKPHEVRVKLAEEIQ